MCRSKTQGGRRCQYHLAEAVTGAVATLASALTGLTRQEADSAMADLRRQGANRPAPTRGEIDAFITEQMWRAQHEQEITKAKRTSVLDRLRAARGRGLPDGATFRSWRHAAAECFARARRKVAAVLLALPLLMSLGAGGNAAQPDAHAAPSGTVATAPASPSSSGVTASQPSVAPATIDQDAVDTFGQERAQAGYDEVTDVVTRYDLQPSLLANTQPTPADLDGIATRMTPSAAADYRAKVQAALAGDATAQQSVQVGVLYGVEGGGFSMADRGQVVTGETVSSPQVSVDRTTGDPRLLVSVEHTATLHGTLNDQPATAESIQSVTYWLTPSSTSSSGWAVDGWGGSYRVLDPVLTR